MFRSVVCGATAPFVVVLAIAGPAAAQQTDATRLEEINVEGRGTGGGEGGGKGKVDGLVARTSTAGSKTATPIVETPQSLTVIGRDRLDVFEPTSASEAFRYTPGIAADVYGADSRSDNYLTIRGLPANFFQDGLRLPVTRPYGSYRVDPFMVERIEILRGPASILFGQGGPGGTVNYVSRRPTAEPHASVEGQVGTDATLRAGVNVGGAFDPAGVWSYELTALGSRNDLPGDNPFSGERVAIAPSLKFEPNDQTKLTMFASYLHDDTSIDSDFLPASGTVLKNPNGKISRKLYTGDRDFDEYKKDQWSLGYEFEHAFNETFTARQNLRFASVKTDIETVYGAGLNAADPTQRTINRFAVGGVVKSEAFTVDNQLEAKFDIGPTRHKVLFGFDYLRQKSSDFQRFNFATPLDVFSGDADRFSGDLPFIARDENQTLSQAGVYVQDQIKLDRLVVTAGVRYDTSKNDFEDVNDFSGAAAKTKDQAWSPRIGAVYLFDNGWAPYASYSESFSVNPGSSGNLAAGDPPVPFDPSLGKQKEAGVRFLPPGTRHSFSAAVFDIDQTNIITGTTFNAYPEDYRSRGFELEALLQFDSGVRVIGAYTYQDVEITRSPTAPNEVGRRPAAVPDQIAQLFADYTFQTGAAKGLRFGAGVRWNGDSVGYAPAKNFKVKDFTVFDAVASYEIDKWRFSLNATNLTNKTYVAACADATSCFYGPERKVLATVRYTW